MGTHPNGNAKIVDAITGSCSLPNGGGIAAMEGKVVQIDDVSLWVEQGAIHIKAISGRSDPVELTSEAARDLATHLQRMANEIDAADTKADWSDSA